MSDTTFADLGVSERVRAALAEHGITTPFPVQERVLPVVSDGRDVLVSSPTGSGKTLAFGLPLIERLRPGGAHPAALILAPTRELAVQIEDDLSPLAAVVGLSVAVCYGGVNLDAQARRAAGADIIVATPGRLLDLSRRRLVSLKDVSVLVLDEADRMVDMGFLPQVSAIVRLLPRERQTMFFSATLEGAVGEAADRFTDDPALLRLRPADADESLSPLLEQSFVACDAGGRMDVVTELIEGAEDLVLIFCRTKRGTDRLAERLKERGVRALAMHGDLAQQRRERALRRFAEGTVPVLVATDVAARGIDLDDIGLVINFDPPEDREGYTHRVGRTARAGRSGRAVTLVMPDDSDPVARIAASLGLQEQWASTGYPSATPRVVYNSRKRGSVFAPQRRPRPRPVAAADAPPRRNRIKRGTVRPVG